MIAPTETQQRLDTCKACEVSLERKGLWFCGNAYCGAIPLDRAVLQEDVRCPEGLWGEEGSQSVKDYARQFINPVRRRGPVPPANAIPAELVKKHFKRVRRPTADEMEAMRHG